MIRYILFLLFIFSLISYNSKAQSETVGLTNIDIPTSPAFILMDEAPTSIEKPNSTKAFALSLLNSFKEAKGLPQNYAIDFTPFWFFKQRNMTALKYGGLNRNDKPNPFYGLKMASVSMAYINTNDSIKTMNNIAFGARADILKIHSKKHNKDLFNSNLVVIDQLRGRLLALRRAGVTDSLYQCCPEDYRKLRQDVLNMLSEAEDYSPLDSVLQEKPLFAIGMAVAFNTNFQNNKFSSRNIDRFGTWITISFSKSFNNTKTNYVNIYGIGRYLTNDVGVRNNKDILINDFFDFGGKGELEFNRFSIGYEYVWRKGEEYETFRSSGELKYKITENICLTGSFGKNFGEENNLISLLGIKWGFDFGTEVAEAN